MLSKIRIISLAIISLLIANVSAQEISSYIKVGESYSSISELSVKIKDALKEKEFIFIGDYKPENKSKFKVLTFTRKDLMNTCLKVEDRGALASVIKVGLVKKDNKVTISYLNPDYIFHAYLKTKATTYKTTFDKISADLKEGLKAVGSDFTEFGGSKTAAKLHKYHYMMMMPYFSDPVTLKEFSSFDEGVRIIKKNLANRKKSTVKVYELVFNNKKIAVFGVGLHSSEDGEAVFLPKIGEEHVAGMPYEIILEDKKATILHGKYRLALHWPKLSMGTFMKIMSTPGNIKDTLESLTEE
jgi:hypothetical protein